jgi:hypothetical protein
MCLQPSVSVFVSATIYELQQINGTTWWFAETYIALNFR